MIKRAACFLPVFLLTAFLIAQNSAPAQKRFITEKDLFDFIWVADPQISPDGARVAFVRVNVNEKKLGYETSIWLVPMNGGEPRRLTTGPHDSSPRWSPDGARIAFVRASEKDGKPQPGQLALLSMTGGEPLMLTTLPKGAAAPAWSPDGKTIAFVSDTNAEDLAKEKEKEKEQKKDSGEHESDVRIITRAIYRDNDEGYIDDKHHTHIWTLPSPTSEEVAKPRQLTTGMFDEGEPKWSPDGSRLYFLSTRLVEPYYELPISVLYSIPSGGGPITEAVRIDGEIDDFAINRSGSAVTFVGTIVHPVASYYEPHLFVADLRGGRSHDLMATTPEEAGSGIIGDQHAPRGGRPSSPVWVGDAAIIEAATARGVVNLMRFDPAQGKPVAVTTGPHDLMAWSATPDGAHLAVTISTPTSLGDVFAVERNGQLRQLTHFNDKLFSQLAITPPEEFEYTSFDGQKIEAWIQKPPNFDPSKKYPMILNIHGGPHASYGYTFFHEMQWMAAKGYVVLYPNPRGSSSYGQKFGNIIQYHYPGDDYKDLMAGVDEVIKRGYVDPKKLGVTGGSGGGVLTNWAVTQTDRFAAAASQRSIADWAAWWYTADFTLFQPNWFRGAPFQDPQDFAQRSAITHIANATTPLMLIEGEADLRTPPGPGGETMFRAYKYMKKPTVMVRFPGETHELSRSGQPWHRVERLEHIVNWFDKYLQGKEIHLYDMPTEEESVKKPEELQKPEAPPK